MCLDLVDLKYSFQLCVFYAETDCVVTNKLLSRTRK